jgi:hypothetical protein
VPCVTMVRCPMMCKGLTDNENYCQLYKDCIMSLIENLEIINWQRKTDIFSRQYFVPETRIQGLQKFKALHSHRPTPHKMCNWTNYEYTCGHKGNNRTPTVCRYAPNIRGIGPDPHSCRRQTHTEVQRQSTCGLRACKQAEKKGRQRRANTSCCITM